MVGLPARGKSYIAFKLNNYLNWRNLNSKIFNVGYFRRKYFKNKFIPNKSQILVLFMQLRGCKALYADKQCTNTQ